MLSNPFPGKMGNVFAYPLKNDALINFNLQLAFEDIQRIFEYHLKLLIIII